MQKQHESHADRIPSNSLWSIIHNQIMLLTSARIHEGIFQFSDFPTLDAERSASKNVLQSFIERNWNLLPSQTYHRLLCADWKILISTFTSWLIRSIDSRIKRRKKESNVQIIKIRSKFMYSTAAMACRWSSNNILKDVPKRFLRYPRRQKKFLCCHPYISMMLLFPSLLSCRTSTCQSRVAHTSNTAPRPKASVNLWRKIMILVLTR